MPNQANFSTRIQVGDDTLVITNNAKLNIPVPVDINQIRVTPDLTKAGVTVTTRGIKFPGNGKFQAIVIVDKTFKEIRVQPLTVPLLIASLVKSTPKALGEIKTAFARIDPKGKFSRFLAVLDTNGLEESLIAYYKKTEDELEKAIDKLKKTLDQKK